MIFKNATVCDKIRILCGDLYVTVDKNLILRQIKLGPDFIEAEYPDDEEEIARVQAELYITRSHINTTIETLMGALGGEVEAV